MPDPARRRAPRAAAVALYAMGLCAGFLLAALASAPAGRRGSCRSSSSSPLVARHGVRPRPGARPGRGAARGRARHAPAAAVTPRAEPGAPGRQTLVHRARTDASSDASENDVTTAPDRRHRRRLQHDAAAGGARGSGAASAVATGTAMTALGAGLKPGGTIRADKLDLVALTVRQMATEARALGAERVVVACTAPARMAGQHARSCWSA